MAVQHGGACFDTPIEAAASMAASQNGTVVAGPGGPQVMAVSVASTSPLQLGYSLTDIGTADLVSQVSVPVSFPACTLLTLADGLEVSWGIGAAWIITFAVLQMRKAVAHDV